MPDAHIALVASSIRFAGGRIEPSPWQTRRRGNHIAARHARGERVQREAEHYTTLTQMASASVKIISDTVAGWRQAGHPLRDHSRSFSRADFSKRDWWGEG